MIDLSAVSPLPDYRQRLSQREREVQLHRDRLDRVGQARLIVFLLGIAIAAGGSISKAYSPLWCFTLIVPLLALVARSQSISRSVRLAERGVRFYRQGIDRLEGRWSNRPLDGASFHDPQHLYSADLDLFGPGSCFQLLNTARTHLGQAELARWLKEPAPAEEVRSRQAAIRDLAPRLDLREELSVCGVDSPSGTELTRFLAWAVRPRLEISSGRRRWIFFLGYLNLAAAIGWALFETSSLPLMVTFTISLLSVGSLRKWAVEVLRPLDEIEKNLSLIETLLSKLEKESFASPRLQQLQASLRSEQLPPSEQLDRLHRLIDRNDSGRNGMFLPFRILLLWDVRMAFHFEDWRAISGGRIDAWFRAIAEVEALLSLASHAYENPEDIFPEIDDSRLLFHARGLGHPLLPKDRGVRNDVSLDEEVRLLMVSGSNMSGKSTLLRAIGLNLVIALAGGTVRATELRVSPLQIGATIRVQDSLQDGRSRFFAEVSRVRGVLEAAEKGRFPLLFLLDELFSGTNSSDRERGAEGVLKKLLELRTLGLVTTHDLALTRIGERFGERARNVHFADEVIDGQLHFDYRMKPGVVPHGNGVALMRMVGLEV